MIPIALGAASALKVLSELADEELNRKGLTANMVCGSCGRLGRDGQSQLAVWLGRGCASLVRMLQHWPAPVHPQLHPPGLSRH